MLNDSLLPKKVAEAQKILAQFSGLTKQELEMAIRRKNLLILADKIRHKETEFLNEIDHLLTQNFSEDLIKISNAPENPDHLRSRKSRNPQPHSSTRRIRTGRSAHPRWNSSSKIINFLGSRNSVIDQTEEDNRSNPNILRPSVTQNPIHPKIFSQASERNNIGQHSVSKERPISQYQSEKKLPALEGKKFNKNATHRLKKDSYSMCYEDYRKAEDSKFGDWGDRRDGDAHDDYGDKENQLRMKVPNNTQNFNRRLGKDKLSRRKNNLDDGR
jgi:hypothetical protein